MIAFTIPGRAQPAGSKSAIPFVKGKNPDGSLKLGVALRDGTKESAERHAAWRERVSSFAAQAMSAAARLPVSGALVLSVRFVFTRPKGHLRKRGQLSKSAPRHHTTYPDLTKLVRALEDALTGIVWVDDKQVAEHRTNKAYGPRDETLVVVTALDDTEPNPPVLEHEQKEFFRAEL